MKSEFGARPNGFFLRLVFFLALVIHGRICRSPQTWRANGKICDLHQTQSYFRNHFDVEENRKHRNNLMVGSVGL